MSASSGLVSLLFADSFLAAVEEFFIFSSAAEESAFLLLRPLILVVTIEVLSGIEELTALFLGTEGGVGFDKSDDFVLVSSEENNSFDLRFRCARTRVLDLGAELRLLGLLADWNSGALTGWLRRSWLVTGTSEDETVDLTFLLVRVLFLVEEIVEVESASTPGARTAGVSKLEFFVGGGWGIGVSKDSVSLWRGRSLEAGAGLTVPVTGVSSVFIAKDALPLSCVPMSITGSLVSGADSLISFSSRKEELKISGFEEERFNSTDLSVLLLCAKLADGFSSIDAEFEEFNFREVVGFSGADIAAGVLRWLDSENTASENRRSKGVSLF